jgi:TonB-linked SusC/RagA family outer membrane protein
MNSTLLLTLNNRIMTKTIYLYLLLLFSGGIMAQKVSLTGKVSASEDGSPLPGVSISIKGTNNGVITDALGTFKLSANKGEALVISYIGFKTQEITLGNQTNLIIALDGDVGILNEVVVTALGITKKKNELAYSAQKVEGEAISQTRDANFVNSLSGKVAGLEIRKNNTMGGSTNIVLRGAKSLTGNNQALFVVDGVPFDNSNTNGSNQANGYGGYDYGNAAADMNPDDIASIEVLKGAAATALYGSRASNGVIMITTKKGSNHQGIGVTINTGLTIGKINKSTFVNYQKEYGGGYGPFYEDPSGFFLSRDINVDGKDDLVTPLSEDASYGSKFDPSLQVYQWDAFDPASPNFGKARPWVAAANDPSTFFKDAITKSSSIVLDQSGDKGYFKLGYTRNAETGILPNSNLTKDLANFSASYKLTSKLTASAMVNISNVEGLGRYGTGYEDRNIAFNFRQWWQTNVDIKELKEAYFRNKKNVTWNWTGPTDLTPIYWDNPYFSRYENYENDNRFRTFGNTMLNYKVFNWLNIMGRVSVDSYSELREERKAVSTIGVSSYKRTNNNFSESNYDLMANFDKNISPSLTLKGVLGTNIRKNHFESIVAITNGGLIVPRLYALSNSKSPLEAPIENLRNIQVNGVFANISLGYKDFLFLDGAIRQDQSSTLPKGKNSYLYPSISAGFVFSHLIDTPWLTLGKLRLNYAEVGNSAPALSINDVYTPRTAFGNAPLYSVSTLKNNPDLKPERTKSTEGGIEIAMLKGRLGFDVTYYLTNSVDQIVPISVSRATGYDSKYINAGVIQNKGFEVQLYGTPIKTKNFSWTATLNWSRNRNLVKELPVENLQLGSYFATINAALGQPYGTIRGSNFVYNDKSQKIIDADGYYEKTATSNEIIGNVNPNWIGGLNNTFKFKNLSFNFLIDIRNGGNMFTVDKYYGLATGILKESIGNNELGNPSRNAVADGGGILLSGVLADGTPNTKRVENVYGVYGYVNNPDAAFVYDISYVKLRELAFTYSIPTKIMKNFAIFKGIDLSVVGRNLAILHKNITDTDPEDTLSSGNIQGLQNGSYPSTRNVGFNLKFKF